MGFEKSKSNKKWTFFSKARKSFLANHGEKGAFSEKESEMIRKYRTTICLIALIFFVGSGWLGAAVKKYLINPVPFTKVAIRDEFWSQRLETNRAVTIPFIFKKNEETGRIDNFAIAGGLMQGTFKGERYNDTDVYKTIEGASYSLAVKPDAELEKYLDSVIAKIAAAQEDDGYLFTPRTCDPDHPLPGIGDRRWSNLPVSHELYNAGHLYESAVAHYLATGKKTLLDAAIKNADLVASVFGPGKRRGFPGHQEIELGLIKLYRVTGKEKYLNLAKFFLDERGREVKFTIYPPNSRFAIYNDPVQIQAHKPVLEQDEAVGHAVRAVYMYSGMADVAALTGNAGYIKAIEKLWENVVSKKMYLTGGIGARHEGESFGADYELPNLTAYNETCAAIGNAFWNQRMFLLSGDSKYLDVMERVVYNGIISGVSLEGNAFFYPNPLESDGKFKFNKGRASRAPWFGVACCPGNIARFIPSFPGYVYATKNDTLFVNLFVGNFAEVDLKGQKVSIRQETRYPWEGRVKMTVTPQKAAVFSIHVRIPGWARSQPLPSDLYSYLDRSDDKVTLKVNGAPAALDMEKGFARIRKTWRKGDVIELSLPLAARRAVAHEAVKEDAGKVAVERGPIVYCAEGADNGGSALNLVLRDDALLKAEYYPDLLNGVMAVKADGILLIPYYAWAHRGEGEMAVWLRRK